MALKTEFLDLPLADVHRLAQEKHDQGERFVQILCVNTDDGIDIIYSFMADGHLTNYTVAGVKKGTKVPSISDIFLEAFVFENESHDLFGVEIEGIAIDFGGNFYRVAEKEPMTIISPAQKEAKEKAAKVAAAKAAKEAGKGAPDAKGADDDMEKKLEGMDPEKAAKLKAALEAKAAREAAKKDDDGKDGE